MSVRIAGVMVMAISLTGCEIVQQYSLSYKLWTNDDLRSFAEPAPDPRLALFAYRDGQEVLVQYDETSERREGIQRRAYFLGPNVERVALHQQPRFVDPQSAASMSPVPRSKTQTGWTNAVPGQAPLAVWLESGHEFTLLRDQEADGPYALPTYRDSNGTLVRVTLTPFAAAGDTVMVGVVAAVVAVVAACQSGLSVSP